MSSNNTIERARIEARARRLASAVVTAHRAYEIRTRTEGNVEEAWHELDDRVHDLSMIGQLLPTHHVTRLAAEHVRIAHARWTEDPEAERLPLALALALLERAITETDRGYEAA